MFFNSFETAVSAVGLIGIFWLSPHFFSKVFSKSMICSFRRFATFCSNVN